MSAAAARVPIADSPPCAPPPRSALGGILLGVSLGGFFDGILLHQILQWHHLLSGLDGVAFRDIRVQILADGLFHLVMYGVALTGLWLVWRQGAAAGLPVAGRRLAAQALAGFGLWHLADIVLFHRVLGLHRVRLDVDDKLFWDVLWLAMFGLGGLAAAAALSRHRDGGGTGDRMAAALLSHGTTPSAIPRGTLPGRVRWPSLELSRGRCRCRHLPSRPPTPPAAGRSAGPAAPPAAIPWPSGC